MANEAYAFLAFLLATTGRKPGTSQIGPVFDRPLEIARLIVLVSRCRARARNKLQLNVDQTVSGDFLRRITRTRVPNRPRVFADPGPHIERDETASCSRKTSSLERFKLAGSDGPSNNGARPFAILIGRDFYARSGRFSSSTMLLIPAMSVMLIKTGYELFEPDDTQQCSVKANKFSVSFVPYTPSPRVGRQIIICYFLRERC